MPFLTEEIWHHIALRTPDEALIIANYPVQKDFDNEIILKFDMASAIISGIRTIRKDKNIPFRDPIKLYVINRENNNHQFNSLIRKLTNTSAIDEVLEKVDGVSFRVKSNEYFVPISEENIDVDAEIEKLESELKRAKGFLSGIQKKLSNERFVQNAPNQVIVLERKKESDTLSKIKTILTSLDRLK